MQIEAIWKNNGPALKQFVAKQVRDEATVKDLLQDVFEKAILHVGEVRDQQKLKSWLFQITRNVIMDYYRKKNKSIGTEINPQGKDYYRQENFNQKLASWLPLAMKSLPEKYRQALYLADIKGMPQKELAKQLNISYSGAKSRVQRGREKLKDYILQCCEVDTDNYGNVLDYQPKKNKCGNC